MRKSLLENIIGFLLGVVWALMIISALFLFLLFWHSGILIAVGIVLIDITFWLFFILLLELAALQIEKRNELKKQTEILEEIQKKLA